MGAGPRFAPSPTALCAFDVVVFLFILVHYCSKVHNGHLPTVAASKPARAFKAHQPQPPATYDKCRMLLFLGGGPVPTAAVLCPAIVFVSKAQV
jgi:hypothetical protein